MPTSKTDAIPSRPLPQPIYFPNGADLSRILEQLHAESGEVLEGDVRTVKLKDGSERKFLVVQDKIIPVELPDSLKDGDHVSFRIEKIDNKYLLKILSVTSGETFEPMSPEAAVRKAIANLLEKLNIGDSALQALKTILRSLPKMSREDMNKSFDNTGELPAELHSFASNEFPISDRNISSSKELGKALRISADTLRSQFEAVKGSIKIPSGEKESEVIRRFEEALRKALTTLSDTPKKSSASVQTPSLSFANSQNLTPVGKLVEVLRAMNSKAAESGIVPSEAKLREFVSAHLDSVTKSEEKLRTTLRSTHTEGPVAVLLQTLKGIETGDDQNRTALDKKFILFIAGFTKELESAAVKSGSDSDLYKLLQRALDQLDRDFKPALRSSVIQQKSSMQVSPGELSKDLQVAFRSIESQILTILGDYTLGNFGSEKGGTIESVRYLLSYLSTLSSAHREDSVNEKEKDAVKFVKNLEKEMKRLLLSLDTGQTSKDVVERSLRNLLAGSLSPLYERIPQTLAPSSIPRELSPALQIAVRNIEAQLRDILGTGKENGAVDPNALKSLKDTLRELANLLSNSQETARGSFADFLTKLSQSLDSSALTGRMPKEILVSSYRELLTSFVALPDDAPMAMKSGLSMQKSLFDLLRIIDLHKEPLTPEKLLASSSQTVSQEILKLLSLSDTDLSESLRSGMLLEKIRAVIQTGQHFKGDPKVIEEFLKSISSLQNLFQAELPGPREVRRLLADVLSKIFNSVPPETPGGLSTQYQSAVSPPFRDLLSQIENAANQTTAKWIEEFISSLSTGRGGDKTSSSHLQVLLKSALTVKIDRPTRVEQEIFDAISSTLRHLEREENTPQTGRDSQRRFQNLLHDTTKTIRLDPKSELIHTLKHEFAALKKVEQLIQGQELLERMNPVMKALGEPMFILFPGMLQGLLSKVECSILPDSVDPEDKKKASGIRANSRGYARARLSLTLPTGSKVGVDIAHRQREVFLNLTFENEALKEFALQRSGNLDIFLRALGNDEITLTMTHGPVKSAQPEWVKTIVQNEGIIA